MAGLFLKTLVFGRSKSASPSYLPVSAGSPLLDPERASSEASTLAGDERLGDHIKDDSTAGSSRTSARISPRIISDCTIGLSDGLTVPFALTAGLSALGDAHVVIYGGLAELIAGGISMGLGGYLGAKSEAEAYAAALTDTRNVVADDSARAARWVRGALSPYCLPEEAMDEVVRGLLLRPEQLVDFLMRFHHQLAEADYAPSRAYISGLTISLGYFFGGLVPLLPYLFVDSVHDGFLASVVVMAIALFVFGWLKTSLVCDESRWTCFKNGVQMIILGGVAAGAAMGCVKAVGT